MVISLLLPNRTRSIIPPMAIINIPLNEDTPPKDKNAQQKPNVVVGIKNKPAIGITGFGTPSPSWLKHKSTIKQPHQNRDQTWCEQINSSQEAHRYLA